MYVYFFKSLGSKFKYKESKDQNNDHNLRTKYHIKQFLETILTI